MKTLGIVGGIGPESTIEYYRAIIDGYRRQSADGSSPAIVLNSVDVNTLLALMNASQLVEVTEYLVAAVERLARAGVDFGIIAANTPHIVFGEVQRRSAIPLLSIVEATSAEARKRGVRKVGLLGTRFTMQATFYQEVFTPQGVSVAVPGPDEQSYIHQAYVGELLKNVFLPETRERLLQIIGRMKAEEQVEAIILGGTELPLLLRDDSGTGPAFAGYDADPCAGR